MKLFNADCLDILRRGAANSVDALVTDPPAGISFMGKDWDDDKGGREEWIAWLTNVSKECYRVMKPGAHGLVWAIPRTSHWTATALENAGFEIRDVVTHLFGTGFPKSLDVSKAIDKAAGAEREIVGEKGGRYATPKQDFRGGKHHAGAEVPTALFNQITAPATDAAKQWQGWHTALKPAAEFWILIRKPLSEKSVAANVLRWGTGAMNIDACRIGAKECAKPPECSCVSSVQKRTGRVEVENSTSTAVTNAGDLPNAAASTIHSGGSIQTDMFALSTGMTKNKNTFTSLNIATSGDSPYLPAISSTTSTKTNKTTESKTCNSCGGQITLRTTTPGAPSGRFPANLVLDEEAAAALDAQSGVVKRADNRTHCKAGGFSGEIYGDSKMTESSRVQDGGGGASRFFYVAKASKSDKNEGLDDREATNVNDGRNTPIDNPFQRGETQRLNTHPTVKSTALMEYLIKLITPPGGKVLDPFMGSGSTGKAAVHLGFQFVGIEKVPEYFEIAKARIEAVIRKGAA